MKYCTVKGCENKHLARGYCRKHYARFHRHGDTSVAFIVGENLSKHPLYNTWAGMKQRCNDTNHVSYEYYMKQGVKICERWTGIYGFKNFVKDMGDKPSPKHSIDRIDINGNYEPLNCRWATSLEQVKNRRLFKNNTSGHIGVTFNKASQKWRAQKRINSKVTGLGYFDTKEEAIKRYEESEVVIK